MQRMSSFRSALGISVVCLLILSGCGGKKGVTVNGKLVPGNLKLAETDSVEISFSPEAPGGKAASGMAKGNDPSFVVNSADGKGVEPGKYKVGVRIQPYMGSAGAAGRASALEKINKDYDPTKTKLTYEVTGDATQSITVDLAKGTVTKD